MLPALALCRAPEATTQTWNTNAGERPNYLLTFLVSTA